MTVKLHLNDLRSWQHSSLLMAILGKEISHVWKSTLAITEQTNKKLHLEIQAYFMMIV